MYVYVCVYIFLYIRVCAQNIALTKWQRNGKKGLFFSVLLFVAHSPLTFALSLLFVPPVSVCFPSKALFLQTDKCVSFPVVDQSLLSALGLHAYVKVHLLWSDYWIKVVVHDEEKIQTQFLRHFGHLWSLPLT